MNERPVHGVYRVCGRRIYRGHEPGTEFVASLDHLAAARAISRGDIVLIDQIVPALEPGSYVLPPGWIPERVNQRRRKAPLA